MSHNSKYYCGKIRKKDAKDCKTIESMFRAAPSTSSTSDNGAECNSPSTSIDISASEAVETESKQNENLELEPPKKITDRRLFDAGKYESHYDL